MCIGGKINLILLWPFVRSPIFLSSIVCLIITLIIMDENPEIIVLSVSSVIFCSFVLKNSLRKDYSVAVERETEKDKGRKIMLKLLEKSRNNPALLFSCMHEICMYAS